MKQAFINVTLTLLLCMSLFKFFSPMYKNTQKIRASQKPFSEINLHVADKVSESMEKMSIKTKPQELTLQDLEQRTRKLLVIKSQFANAHQLYATKCLSCHGALGEGGKALYSFDTRLTHRNSLLNVASLKKDQGWNADLRTFFLASSKQNKPHLPQNLQTLETDEISQLKEYLSQLVE